MSSRPPVNTPRAPLPLPAATPLAAPRDFEARLAQIDVSLDADQIVRLGDYLARLLAMNEQVNLTSIIEPGEAWTRHVLDALTLVPQMADLPAGARVLDVGSGGGVPGIPLAIARPDIELTLVDATTKKASFLVAVAHAIGLDNVVVEAARAEDLEKTDLRGSFDAVTARAVAKLSSLLAWTAPFAKRGGRLLFIKGERAEHEISEARKALRRYRCTHERTVLTPTGRVVVMRVG